MRNAPVLVVVCAVSMLLAGVWAYGEAPLQSPAPRSPQAAQPSEPVTVISGNDLGFRVENRRGNTVIGRFVVRVDGQWLEIEEPTVMRRLTQQ